MPLVFFAIHSWEIVTSTTCGNRVLKTHCILARWRRCRVTRTLITTNREQGILDTNAQCSNIFSSKSPTFSLRTSILLLASVILARTGSIQGDSLARKRQCMAPLCEWVNRRENRLNWWQHKSAWIGQSARIPNTIFFKYLNNTVAYKLHLIQW